MSFLSSEQIESKIKDMQQKLHIAKIREGKVDLAQEVKKRILEVAPDIQNLDYILWPLRVTIAKGTSDESGQENGRKKRKWTQEMDEDLIYGYHKKLIECFGFSVAALSCRDNRLGYKFKMDDGPLEKMEGK